MSWAPYEHPTGQYIIFASNKLGHAKERDELLADVGVDREVEVARGVVEQLGGLPAHGLRRATARVLRREPRLPAPPAVRLVGQERVWVAGIQNVFVLPECRGSGLFRQVMSAALEEARERGMEFGLLFCSPDIGQKYARQGWQLLEDRRVTRVDEEGQSRPLPPKNVTMFYPLGGRGLPLGDLHLLGNDW